MATELKVMPATIFVVDDDHTVRSGLDRLLRSAGFFVEAYSSSQEFLSQHTESGPGCVLMDLQMPDINGLQTYERMRETGSCLPVVFLTGRGDVPSSVAAMKQGAVDFLLKPADEELLLQTVNQALTRYRELKQLEAQQRSLKAKLAALSAREREVLDGVVLGRLNKQIAAEMGIAEKTVKVHRGRVMEKMEVRSVAELVRLWAATPTQVSALRPIPTAD